MDGSKRDSLIKWINVMIQDAEIISLPELNEKSTILLQVLRMIDSDLQVSIGTHERNIIYVCQYVTEIFNFDVLDENEILLGNEIAIGKLLCFLLELSLTSTNNKQVISKIQSLPADIQTNIMSMTKMVCDNSQKTNLADIMNEMLRKSVVAESEEQKLPNMPAISPTKPASPNVNYLESPQGKTCSSLNSSVDSTSPLAAFAASPQALYRRVMVENSKLKQKVRHSEMFLQRKNFDEQLAFDVESEKMEVLESNKKLVKEQEHLNQKLSSLDETITKLREEIEFLQLELQSKDKEMVEHINEVKSSKEMIKQLQDTIHSYSEMDLKIQQKQTMYEDEVAKTTTMLLKANKLEQQNSDMKGELIRTKECMEKLNSEMQKKKDDYADQVAHLQENISKLEKSASKHEVHRENLADTLQRDTEISSLNEQNKKLQNTIKAQEATIMNMGYESKQVNQMKCELKAELESCRSDLANLKSKSEASSESYKKQSNQYMDQISTLLKQVEEHAVRNEGLNAKISRTEEKCRMLEKQLEKFEASEKKIHVEIQQQDADLKAKQEEIDRMQETIGLEKSRTAEVKQQNINLENSIKELCDKTGKLQDLEKKCENLVRRNNKLVAIEIEHKALLEQHKVIVSECSMLKNECDKLVTLEEKCKTLSDMNAGLTSNEIKLAEENIKLKNFEKQCVKLSEENKQIGVLVRRNEELLKENGQISILLRDCEKLSEENKKMTDVVNENQRICHENNMKIETLTLENKELFQDNKKIETLTKEREDLFEKVRLLANHTEELTSQNALLKQSENDLHEALSKNVKMADIEKECVALKQELAILKQVDVKHIRQMEEATRLSTVKYQILLNENERLHDIERKYRELSEKFHQLSRDHKQLSDDTVVKTKELEQRLRDMEEEGLKLTEANKKLVAEKDQGMTTLKKLEEDKRKLLEERDTSSHEEDVKSSTRQQYDEKMENQERSFAAERMKLSDEVNDAILKYQESKAENEARIQQEKIINEELADELNEKNNIIERLENKCIDEQAINKRSSANIRSLEAQLQSSDTLIRNLKKEISNLKSAQENEEPKRPATRSVRNRDAGDLSSESDGGFLMLTDLQGEFNAGSRAEEIFQRSRSTRVRNRHSILVLPTCEETETSDNDDKPMARAYSLRQKAERRRSFQPRRYMGGNTPPGRRTLVGEPSQVMCAFSTDAEEEPEMMDDMEWGRIALLKESSAQKTPDEKNRLTELQRRNTLCLPHLKSSYPMELDVTKQQKKDVPEETVKVVNSGKRKKPNEDAPRGTFKKWKTDHALRSSNSNLSMFSRSTQSDSNLRRSGRNSLLVPLTDDNLTEQTPSQSSIAFEITMEPAKNIRPRMSRSNASGNLIGAGAKNAREESKVKEVVTRTKRNRSRETGESKAVGKASHKPTLSSTYKVDKAEPEKFARSDTKRSSFTRATSRVAASFRAKRAARAAK